MKSEQHYTEPHVFHEINCVKITKPSFILKFDQSIVDWINQQYPSRNWYCAGGPKFYPINPSFVRLITNEHDPAPQSLRLREINLSDFGTDCYEFQSEGNLYDNFSVRDLEALIREFAEYVIDQTPDKDIYLYRLTAHGIVPQWDTVIYVSEGYLGNEKRDS